MISAIGTRVILQKSMDVSEQQTAIVCSLEGLILEIGNILQDYLKTNKVVIG